MAQMLTVGKFKPPTFPSTDTSSPYFYGGGVASAAYNPARSPTQPQTRAPTYATGNTGYVPGFGYVTQPPIAPDPIPGGVTPAAPTTPTPSLSSPDWASMIGSSWEVGAAESAMASQMAAARANFQNQLRQSFIDLGYTGDQSQLGDFSKYIDKTTLQKAIDNKYSAYAQIKKQQATASALNDAMLASSGMGVSGTVGTTAQNTIGEAEQARYNALRSFLSGGQQGLAGLGTLEGQLAQGVLAARFAAAQRLAALYGTAGAGGLSGPGTGYPTFLGTINPATGMVTGIDPQTHLPDMSQLPGNMWG